MKVCRLLLSFIFVVLALTACSKPEAYDSNGKPISLSNYKGKWVIINYWATWCIPCINEIPVLNKLAKYYPKDIVVIGVNVDHLDNGVLNKLRQDYQVYYAFTNNFPASYFGVREMPQIPVTFILDRNGNLFQTLSGPQTLETFQAILKLPPIVYNY